jgi:hypothetical protein
MVPMEGVVSAWLDDIKKMRRRDDHGFVDQRNNIECIHQRIDPGAT